MEYSFDEFLLDISTLYEKRKKALTLAKYIQTAWDEHINLTSVWLVLTSMLPGASTRAVNRNKKFFQRFNLTPRVISPRRASSPAAVSRNFRVAAEQAGGMSAGDAIGADLFQVGQKVDVTGGRLCGLLRSDQAPQLLVEPRLAR